MNSSKTTKLPKLVLTRHGQSVWNLDKRFTGRQDIPLSPRGLEEAARAGKALKRFDISFDVVYTSFLCRAVQTYEIISKELECEHLIPKKAWQLNERHYGALTGLSKEETANEYGADMIKKWRRHFDTLPPPMSPDDPRAPKNDPLYSHMSPDLLPLGESLKTIGYRTLPYFKQNILEDIKQGRSVLVVAHNHSLRSIIKELDGISDADIAELTIETGQPIVYEMSPEGVPVKSYLLPIDIGEEIQVRSSFTLLRNV